MKIIQTMLLLITAVTAGLGVATLPASGAVVVNTITVTDWNSLISTHEAAWSVVYRGGGTSGAGSEEIRLTRYRNTEQGGNQTLTGDVSWSASNNVLEVLLNGSGNISARANAVTVAGAEFGVVRPYNQILIRVFDQAPFGSANDLQDVEVNRHSVRNMFADGSGSISDSDIVSIHNFGSQAPFSWEGVWGPGTGVTGDSQYVEIFALQNGSIPEPSSILLIGFTSLFLLRRKRE